jgi:hypothetical protein
MRNLALVAIVVAAVCAGGASLSNNDSAGPLTTTVKYNPAIFLDGGLWLTSLTAVSKIPGYPSLVIQVPCLRQQIGSSFQNFCSPQKLASGPLAGEYVDRTGQIMAVPTQ